MQEVTVEWLQTIEALKNVDVEELQWFIDNSTHTVLSEGELMFKTGDPITGTFIIVKGRIRIFTTQGNAPRELTIVGVKEITGYLPFSRGTTAFATGQALEETQLMTFPVERMQELIHTHFGLTQALVHVMTTRVRDFTALQQQSEKMMALGKLSAGLAHELNNPAAAIVRGSFSLKKHLQLLPETFKQVISIRMSEEQVDAVNNKMFEVLAKKDQGPLTLMQRTSRENELTDWLEDQQVGNSQEIAENFIDYGITLDDLETFQQLIPAQYLSPVLNWINNNLVTKRMVNDIQEASLRISELVSSVKNFTHMDRGQDMQYADIHSGIRNTLVMLNHKFRKGNINLTEQYDHSLPPVKAYVGELNQVWTNIIDNALDAMETNGKGNLQINTEKNDDYVKVSIIDTGPAYRKILNPGYSIPSLLPRISARVRGSG